VPSGRLSSERRIGAGCGIGARIAAENRSAGSRDDDPAGTSLANCVCGELFAPSTLRDIPLSEGQQV
jgi:hypothetical protein